MSDTQHDDKTPARRATWFELFFDLVFVAGVARLAGGLAVNFNAWHLAQTAFLFIVLWWCWIGHTFFATRFDQDRSDQRLTGLLTISIVVFIDFAVTTAFGDGAIVFAVAVGLFKAVLALSYFLAYRRSGEPVARVYVMILSAATAVWLLSCLADEAIRPVMWLVALGIDVVSPFIVTRFTHASPPHPEHLPERFGLFVIILLGESVASLVHALDHLHDFGPVDIAVVGMAMIVPFLFWWGYFDTVRGAEERHVRSQADARRLQLWAYSHIPVLLGTAVLAAGARLVVEHHAFTIESGLMLSGASAAAMVGLTLIALSGSRSGGTKWTYFTVAAITAASGFLAPIFGGPGLLAILVITALVQTFAIPLLPGHNGKLNTP